MSNLSIKSQSHLGALPVVHLAMVDTIALRSGLVYIFLLFSPNANPKLENMKDKTKSQTKTVMALLEWADTYLACMENCTSGGIGDDITELRQQIEEVLDYDPRGIKQDIYHD
jgi:hypothetical protein